MEGQRNLPALNAPLHPNDGNVEPAIAAHGAGSQLVRNHMLSRFCGTRTRMAGRQNLLVPLTLLKIILSISACPHIFCLSSLLSSHTVCPRRCTRMMGMQKLPLPYTVLEASLQESKCSPILCQPHSNDGAVKIAIAVPE